MVPVMQMQIEDLEEGTMLSLSDSTVVIDVVDGHHGGEPFTIVYRSLVLIPETRGSQYPRDGIHDLGTTLATSITPHYCMNTMMLRHLR